MVDATETQTAFEAWLLSHQRFFHAVAQRYCAVGPADILLSQEDLVQDINLRCLVTLRRYQPARGLLKTFLGQQAAYACVDQWRHYEGRYRKYTKVDAYTGWRRARQRWVREGFADHMERRVLVQQLLRVVTRRQRELLEGLLAGETMARIATRYGVTEAAMSKRFGLAQRRIQRRLRLPRRHIQRWG